MALAATDVLNINSEVTSIQLPMMNATIDPRKLQIIKQWKRGRDCFFPLDNIFVDLIGRKHNGQLMVLSSLVEFEQPKLYFCDYQFFEKSVQHITRSLFRSSESVQMDNTIEI